nr:retrotransposon protein, putative, unclassified [Tanacetum cinerariifolium]
MIVGGGLEWLFEIDTFSKSMDYVPVFVDVHNKDKHGPSLASKSDDQERPNTESSTKSINTVGPVNTATPTYSDNPNDPFMPTLEDDGIFDDAYNDRDDGVKADYNNLETMESKKVISTLDDESWVEAMHEELLQFKLLNAWTLMDLLSGKRAIGTKWVYKNKRNQRGIIVRNKSRLVAQGHR